jgi:hypothetical protein
VAWRLNRTSRLKAFDLLTQSLGPWDLTFLSVLIGHFSLLVKDAAVSNRRTTANVTVQSLPVLEFLDKRPQRFGTRAARFGDGSTHSRGFGGERLLGPVMIVLKRNAD